MKKVLMMVAVALMTGVMAMAQENKPCKEGCCKENCCEGKGKDKTEMVRCQTRRMVEKYGLNEDQAARLQALNEAYAGKLPKPGMHGPGMRPGPGGPGMGPRPEGGFKPKEGERPQLTEEQKAACKAEMKKAQEEYDAALKDILTKKQFKAYKKDREKCQEHRPGPKM